MAAIVPLYFSDQEQNFEYYFSCQNKTFSAYLDKKKEDLMSKYDLTPQLKIERTFFGMNGYKYLK